MSDETSVPTFVYEPEASAGSFVMLIAQEQSPTVDGRMFSAGAIDWRELPIPLTLNRVNSAEGQHKTAVGIGAVTQIWRDGNNIYGRGYFSSDEHGQEARSLIKEGTISGVSADVGGVVVEELASEMPEHPSVRKLFTKGTIIGVTALLHASFNDTKIAVEPSADDALTAAASNGWRAPRAAFSNPNLSQPTSLTVTEDGRVFGHAAVWGTCHVGYQDRCVTPPRSTKNYAFFNIGEVLTDDESKVSVGRITANTNHAPIEFGAQPAKDHYDHTGFAAAYVTAGEDEHGIWFSGVVAPDATEAQIANLRAAGVSGDWRNIGGNLEMVGLLAVNTPGFPVPRPKGNIVAGAQMSLIAAGTLAETSDSLQDRLNILLADTVTTYHNAHGFHWNVKGTDFSQYHALFESIYSDLYESIDPIAENIRKLGYDAPFRLSEFVSMSGTVDATSADDPESMANSLLSMLEDLLDSLNATFAVANNSNQQGIANFIAERIDSTMKWMWQLKSSVGDTSVVASGMKGKKDCGCGCKGAGDCADKKVESDSNSEDMFAFNEGKPLDWNTDLDVNFLSGMREHLAAINDMATDANQTGTRLSLKVQAYASYLNGIATSELSLIDRTLDREDSADKAEDAAEGETTEDSDEERNSATKASYETESSLSFEARLALLDLDFELLV